MKKYNILGIIPARGGSKGVPKKNIKLLNGKPLIAYTIEEAKKSKYLTDFIVSTDDTEIKKISSQYGAEVPFLRPKKLSTDKALAVPTIQHAVTEMEKIKKIKYDYIIMLQPTAPLRIAKDIDNALKKLITSNADGIISVIDVGNYHPMKMKIFKDEYLFDYKKPPVENPPRQSLPKVYIVNGAIYATKRDVFMTKNTFKGKKCLGHLMPEERSVNIDNEIDFLIAEYYLKKQKN